MSFLSKKRNKSKINKNKSVKEEMKKNDLNKEQILEEISLNILDSNNKLLNTNYTFGQSNEKLNFKKFNFCKF